MKPKDELADDIETTPPKPKTKLGKGKKKAKLVETSEYEYEGMIFVFIVFFLLTPLLPVESDHTSLRITEERDSKAAEQEEDVEPVEEKSPAKKPKRRST